MAQFYQKINTLWKRDEKNRIIQGDYSLQEFGYLEDCLWLVEEKIDGTNMSYDIYFGSDGSINRTEIHGKTETAKIPGGLLNEMNRIFNALIDSGKLTDVFKIVKTDAAGNTTISWPYKVTIYGEGYGGKIQGGGRYSKTEKFIVFDIEVQTTPETEPLYLLRPSVDDICPKLGLDLVHTYGLMTISEAELIIENIAYNVYTNSMGNPSLYAPDISPFSHNSEDPTLVIEGFVLKSPCGLKTRQGKPLVTKIKVKDYLDKLRKS